MSTRTRSKRDTRLNLARPLQPIHIVQSELRDAWLFQVNYNLCAWIQPTSNMDSLQPIMQLVIHHLYRTNKEPGMR